MELRQIKNCWLDCLLVCRWCFFISTAEWFLRVFQHLEQEFWKNFWSKDDSSHFKNSPSFQISRTYSNVFRTDEKFIHQLSAKFTCRDGKGGKLSSRTSNRLTNQIAGNSGNYTNMWYYYKYYLRQIFFSNFKESKEPNYFKLVC